MPLYWYCISVHNFFLSRSIFLFSCSYNIFFIIKPILSHPCIILARKFCLFIRFFFYFFSSIKYIIFSSIGMLSFPHINISLVPNKFRCSLQLGHPFPVFPVLASLYKKSCVQFLGQCECCRRSGRSGNRTVSRPLCCSYFCRYCNLHINELEY